MAACPCMFDCPARMNTLIGRDALPGAAGGTVAGFALLPVITSPRFGISSMNAVTDDAVMRESSP